MKDIFKKILKNIGIPVKEKTVKLSEIPFNKLYIGMPVISAIGTPGRIIALFDICYDDKGEDCLVNISWDNGKRSEMLWHFWCSNITTNCS